MSNKIYWIVLLVLIGCISWLVVVDLNRSGALGGFEVKTSYNEPVKPTAYRLQPTMQVQKTQSGASLHSLSEGVEMTPNQMLRSGTLSVGARVYNSSDKADF